MTSKIFTYAFMFCFFFTAMSIAYICQLDWVATTLNLTSASILAAPLETPKMDCMVMEQIPVPEPFSKIPSSSNTIPKCRRFGIRLANSDALGMISMRNQSRSDPSLWTCWMSFVQILLVTMWDAGCRFR